MLLPEKTNTNLVFTFQFLNDKIYNHVKKKKTIIVNWKVNTLLTKKTTNWAIITVQVVEFSNPGYKIRKVFAKESTHSKEIIEFWELD